MDSGAPLGGKRVYIDPTERFQITVPAEWEDKQTTNPSVDAAFVRLGSRSWVTVCIGPADLSRGQYTAFARLDALQKLCWMEKDHKVTESRFGNHPNAVIGTWSLDAGRDDGPKGTPRWPVPSRRGLTSIVTGPMQHATEWVIQYRTELNHDIEVQDMISSFLILNEHPACRDAAAAPASKSGCAGMALAVIAIPALLTAIRLILRINP